MITPGKHDNMAIAVVFIMAGLLLGGLGLTAFLQAAGKDHQVASFFAGYTFLLACLARLWHRAHLKQIQRVLEMSKMMSKQADQP